MSKDNKEKSNLPENGDYRDEMEELARIFKEELDKAVQDAEDAAEIDDLDRIEVEGYNPKELSLDSKKTPSKKASEPQPCECCGERPRGTKRNPDSVFCEECEAILEKYPYDWKGILAIVVIVGVVISSIILFAGKVPLFSKAKLGDRAMKDGKLYTALTKYSEAVNYIDEADAENYPGIIAKKIKAEYSLLDMNSAMNDLEKYIPGGVLKLPAFKGLQEMSDSVDEMVASAYIIQKHLYEFNADDYDGIIAELDSLLGKKIYEKFNEFYDETDKDYTPDGTETVYICNEGWINFYKFSAARVAERDEKECIVFLEKAAENSDYLKKFVTPLLAQTCVGVGDYEKAENLLEEIKLYNSESPDYHMVKSMLFRYRDKDYEGAVRICDEGLKMISSLTNGEDIYNQIGYILLTQISLNLAMESESLEGTAKNDKLKEAIELIEEVDEQYASTHTDEYGSGTKLIECRDLRVILSLAAGDSGPYDEAAKEIAEYGDEAIPFHEDVENFKNGKITLSDVVMSGRYDLQ